MTRRRRGRELLPPSAEPPKGVPRRLRVERQVHEQLLGALASLRDPRLDGVRLTRVQMTDDLRLARVYVRLGLGSDSDEAAQRDLMKGLRAASGRLRRDLGAELGLRYTPELRFHYDEREEAVQRVEELLAEIREDSSSPGS